MALVRRELDHQSATADHLLPARGRDLHLSVDDRDPCPLVYLMILEALPRRDLQHDRASIVGGREDLRRMRPKVEAPDIPAVQKLTVNFSAMV